MLYRTCFPAFQFSGGTHLMTQSPKGQSISARLALRPDSRFDMIRTCATNFPAHCRHGILSVTLCKTLGLCMYTPALQRVHSCMHASWPALAGGRAIRGRCQNHPVVSVHLRRCYAPRASRHGHPEALICHCCQHALVLPPASSFWEKPCLAVSLLRAQILLGPLLRQTHRCTNT